MPQYGNFAIPSGLLPGDSFAVWNNENPPTAVGTSGSGFSERINVGELQTYGPPAVGIEVLFGAAPGNFTIDVQEADTDTPSAYVNITAAQITQTALGPSGLAARVDLAATGFRGRFLRLKMTSQPANAPVGVTANIKVG